jgi:nicotinate-nucleotide pyrophosphorylase (carboxylating)
MNKICPQHIINLEVSQALFEDTTTFPDYTANLLIDKIITATIVTRQEMVLCGIAWVNQSFLTLDEKAIITWNYADSDLVLKDSILCKITAHASSILTAERTALNFLQLLSATATITHQYVKQVSSTKVKIMDTRKTIPGLRLAQKYAVTVGGGHNQRIGLYDGVLIKENHIAALGSIKNVLSKAYTETPKHIPIQIEVENFEQLVEAIENGAKLILLDNMSPSQIKKCVEYTNKRAILEASGNINLDTILEYAQTGVDRISIGGLTKNINAIDLSLRIIK